MQEPTQNALVPQDGTPTPFKPKKVPRRKDHFLIPVAPPKLHGLSKLYEDTPEDIERFIRLSSSYFEDMHAQERPLTLMGLCNRLGIDRQKLTAYCKHDTQIGELSRRCRQIIVEFAESNLYSPSGYGALAHLKALESGSFMEKGPEVNITVSLQDMISQVHSTVQPLPAEDAEFEDIDPKGPDAE